MTLEQFEHAAEECTKALEEFALYMKQDGRSKQALEYLKEIASIAKSAIPSGQVAEDDEMVRSALGAFFGKAEPHVALDRLSAKAQSAEVWRKRVEAASEALADVLPGEAGRLDLLARINELRRQRDEARRAGNRLASDVMQWEAKARDAEARCAGLAAAGQVLSEHVDKTAGGTLGDVDVVRNALGMPELTPESRAVLAERRAERAESRLNESEAKLEEAWREAAILKRERDWARDEAATERRRAETTAAALTSATEAPQKLEAKNAALAEAERLRRQLQAAHEDLERTAKRAEEAERLLGEARSRIDTLEAEVATQKHRADTHYRSAYAFERERVVLKSRVRDLETRCAHLSAAVPDGIRCDCQKRWNRGAP